MNAHTPPSPPSPLLCCQYCGRKTLGQAPDASGAMRGLCPVYPCLDQWADDMSKAYDALRKAAS